tara:strand:- start:1207 stop:3171 length:1965 start_codon:yes stop_codon:yes gene_type:complete
MAIKKYVANKDNTITNGFGVNLSTRGTGSNMGASDILEVYSIYGQQTTSSVELSRALVQFPTSDIQTDRTNGDIPASGSVNFFLRLFNARHSEQLPRDYTFSVLAVSQSWQEGYGLDMESYLDITKDNIDGSNWINATSNITKATLVDAIDISGHANGDKFTMTVPAIAGGDGVTYTFLFDSTTNVNNDTGANTFGISRQIVADDGALRDALVDAINGTANSAVKYGAADTGDGSTLTAGTIGLTAKAGTGAYTVTLTMDTDGSAGNVANVLNAVTNFAEGDKLVVTAFTDGDGPWASVGGHYHTSSYTSGSTMPNYTYDFKDGHEDLLVDVTDAVEEWLGGNQSNYGFGVFLTSSYEGYTSNSSGVDEDEIPHNVDGQQKSFYTKRFFSRTSEFFFKRPALEARWDDRTLDDRGNFYASSSIAPAADNLNNLYLYNYIRGRLVDIPNTETLKVNIHDSSDDAPTGAVLTSATAAKVKTGVYKAEVSYATTGTILHDVWSGSVGGEYKTGSIAVKSFNDESVLLSDDYGQFTTKITNLKPKYSNQEKARFRVFTRPRNFSPTIYNVASKEIQHAIVPSASYEIVREVNDEIVINNSTGSATQHTYLSYDNSGSYFDLDMSLLQPGYMYGIKLYFYISEAWREQEEVFNFRVEDR